MIKISLIKIYLKSCITESNIQRKQSLYDKTVGIIDTCRIIKPKVESQKKKTSCGTSILRKGKIKRCL